MYKVGIIGGGQLGKMMILDGKRLDTQFFILDPIPAEEQAALVIRGDVAEVMGQLRCP